MRATNSKPFSNYFADLQETLPNSFDILDQSLLQMEETTTELRNQGAPEQQINEIIVST